MTRIRFLLILVGTAMASVAMTACTRSSIPSENISTARAIETEIDLEKPVPTPRGFAGESSYAVVWVAEGETLTARKPAGISGSIIGELAFDQRGIKLIGDSTLLGSSLWVEIQLPSGGGGWVNTWNLTEDVPAGDFCNDPEVITLLETLGRVLTQHDDALLASIVNPDRGLILRHDWWNPDVQVPQKSIEGLFSNRMEVDWGFLSSSDFAVTGSFPEVMLPLLEDVFFGNPQMVCNELIAGYTTREMAWPAEFHNMNFYSIHRPAVEGSNPFGWQTWGVGIEYIEGKAYLSVLIMYRGDI